MHTLDTAQRTRSVLSFPFDNCKMSLRILSYNIAGLLPKLDNVAFVNYITSFDLACLTETYVATEFESNLFKDFGVFVAKAKKTLIPRKVFRGRYGTCEETFCTFRGAYIFGYGQYCCVKN